MATLQSNAGLSPSFLSQSQRPSLYAAAFITYILATSAVILRFLARRLRHLPIWYDDWLCVVAWLAVTAFFIDELVWIHVGLGVHYQVLPDKYITIVRHILLNLFIEDYFYSTATVFVKLSLLAFYRRIFNVPSIRLPIWIMAGCVVFWLVARYISLALHCIPPAAYWDKTIPHAHCGVNDRSWFIGTVTPNFIMDLIVLMLPMPYLKKLQVARSQKLIVFGMFTFGSFVVAISIILLVVCSRLDTASPDVSWTISPIVIWAGTEINLSVVTSCLPSLRPIYLLLTKGSADPDSKMRKTRFTDMSSRLRDTYRSKRRYRPGKTFSALVTETGDELHPFSVIRDVEANGEERGEDGGLGEMQVPGRVRVREDVSVEYSNV